MRRRGSPGGMPWIYRRHQNSKGARWLTEAAHLRGDLAAKTRGVSRRAGGNKTQCAHSGLGSSGLDGGQGGGVVKRARG
jgi:hypothetical protein